MYAALFTIPPINKYREIETSQKYKLISTEL